VHAEDVASPVYRLSVVDRPAVKLLRVLLRPPAYTGLQAHQLDDNIGDILGLRGTRATITIETNKPLATASLVRSDSTTLPLEIHRTTAAAEFPLRQDHSYHLYLRDSLGIANADPIEYAVRVQTDARPTVAIVAPGTDLDVTEATEISMLIKVGDDFGVSRLTLMYRLTQSRYGATEEQPRRVLIPLPGVPRRHWFPSPGHSAA
jgi:hypothetical protein